MDILTVLINQCAQTVGSIGSGSLVVLHIPSVAGIVILLSARTQSELLSLYSKAVCVSIQETVFLRMYEKSPCGSRGFQSVISVLFCPA